MNTNNAKVTAGLLQIIQHLELRPHLDVIGTGVDYDGSARVHVRSVESLIAEFPTHSIRCDVRPPHIFRYIMLDGVSYMDILASETSATSCACR